MIRRALAIASLCNTACTLTFRGAASRAGRKSASMRGLDVALRKIALGGETGDRLSVGAQIVGSSSINAVGDPTFRPRYGRSKSARHSR